MELLPINVITQIFKFLSVGEIYSKLALSKHLTQLLQNQQVQRLILCTYYPRQLMLKFSKDQYMNLLKTLKNGRILELPFWGIETNGGLTGNSLRFWIGKSFMNTDSQQVSLARLENSFIQGILALDSINLKSALVQYTKKFIQILGMELSQTFYTSNSLDVCAEKIKIFDLFLSFQYLEDFEDQNIFDGLQYLYLYQYCKNLQIVLMTSTDLYNLKDDDFQILPLAISLVKGVKICRRTFADRIIKTILLITSEDQYIKDNTKQNLRTVDELYSLIKSNGNQYTPTQTNIPILQQFCDQGQFDNSKQLEYLYCTFEPKGQLQPLLWLQFVNPNNYEIALNFNEFTQRLAKSVQLKFFDVDQQEDFEYSGISFGYVSILGYILDSKDLNMLQVN
ncbi:unnamed protein product (macronuclear) [Paramecium tetraurelia]|uniref:F-box domain-containing protein n=1 Tax=Paramecium tetraurelia TaxID=5888 RepID=A0DVQ9_PARTE|nr:uncharacterized protein GSPATT00020779001 [Paramecium tetraurelia]CAK87126.1 unnamed protein product [Paramecium tetraurelia]|eukprot:XP_001454523.1 hypothetical protein (macronuclear) [Paramecium tetraurelia strain d4-2]